MRLTFDLLPLLHISSGAALLLHRLSLGRFVLGKYSERDTSRTWWSRGLLSADTYKHTYFLQPVWDQQWMTVWLCCLAHWHCVWVWVLPLLWAGSPHWPSPAWVWPGPLGYWTCREETFSLRGCSPSEGETDVILPGTDWACADSGETMTTESILHADGKKDSDTPPRAFKARQARQAKLDQ